MSAIFVYTVLPSDQGGTQFDLLIYFVFGA